jgi:hypothetical protein
MFFLRPFKGHVRDRTRAERAAKITKALATVDDKIAKHRQVILINTSAFVRKFIKI